jgi:hypothetical protein
MKKTKCDKCKNELFYMEEEKDKVMTKCNQCNHTQVECWI